MTRNRGFSQLHRLEIPEGVTPGSEFTALVGSRQIQIQCPRSSRPGHFVRVSLPGEPITRQKLLKMAPLTKMEDLQDNENTHLNESKRLAKKKKTMRQQQKEQKGIKIKVPTTIQPGVDFTATVRGKRYLVTCPDKLPSNRQIKIIPSLDENGQKRTVAPKTQLFDVTVPKGVKFNDYFDILANGQRVTVQCPPDASEGDTFRCKLALEDILSQIQLRYESISGAGWHRIVRREDLKLQWVYFDPDSDDTEEEKENKHALPSQAKIGQFDIKRSAFCRKLTVQAGKDPRMQTGSLTLVPADEALVESKLLSNTPTVKDRILAKSAYESIMTYGDIAVFQGKPLKDKAEWFRSTCNQLAGSRDDGSIKIVLQRETLLEDSVNAVMSLGKEDLRKVWRFEFVGEPGVDSGGVSREWFQLASEQIFDPENGLWLCSASNQTCVTINPDSGTY